MLTTVVIKIVHILVIKISIDVKSRIRVETGDAAGTETGNMSDGSCSTHSRIIH